MGTGHGNVICNQNGFEGLFGRLLGVEAELFKQNLRGGVMLASAKSL